MVRTIFLKLKNLFCKSIFRIGLQTEILYIILTNEHFTWSRRFLFFMRIHNFCNFRFNDKLSLDLLFLYRKPKGKGNSFLEKRNNFAFFTWHDTRLKNWLNFKRYAKSKNVKIEKRLKELIMISNIIHSFENEAKVFFSKWGFRLEKIFKMIFNLAINKNAKLLLVIYIYSGH